MGERPSLHWAGKETLASTATATGVNLSSMKAKPAVCNASAIGGSDVSGYEDDDGSKVAVVCADGRLAACAIGKAPKAIA